MNLNEKINKIIENLNNKEFKTVINSCEKLIDAQIENTIIYNLCGKAYQNLALYEKSIPRFEKSIELNKNNYFALNNLAISLKALEKYQLSEKNYKKCLKIKPDFLTGYINFANLKEFLNEFEEAINLYSSALKLTTGTTEAYIFSKLSRLYLTIGEIERARDFAIKCIKKYPMETNYYELFSEMIDLNKDKQFLIDMENLYNSQNLNDSGIINLVFPLGQVEEKLKNYKKAFFYFSEGNKLKKKQINFNINDLISLRDSIKKTFASIQIDKIKKEKISKKLIFICGMPRSGTTLIEQIISSHSEVLPTGENNFLSTYIRKNYLKDFSLSEENLLKDCISKENLFQDYVFNLFNEYKYVSDVFTDKSIQNFLWIGFIKIFFPNSKIIITERNPKDVCLSIFKNNFVNGFMNFAYDQKDIANFYNIYLDLVNFWKKIFKKDIYSIKYENLIENSELEIKKLINFCDLSWDPNCLKHHQNKSGIRTASINQARKPIYKSSKNLNQNYAEHLEEMFALLKT